MLVKHTEKWVAATLLLFCVCAVLLHMGSAAVRAADMDAGTPVLVVDAGHGGFDGGAVSASGVSEQDINLAVARRVCALAAFFGVRTAETRPDENALDYDPSRRVRDNKVADIRAREAFVQQFADPVFLSIHLNKFEDPQYHGAQVFYSPNHAGSRTLAELLQASLIRGCDPANHREAKQADRSIYLMKTLTCPAVIAECGFLSNPEEERRLADPGYQKQLAAAITHGYLQYISARA